MFFTTTSLLAALTIAGAFWVGVLAARRLRDWGDGRRALDEAERHPLALAAATGTPPNDAGTQRVRALVAARIQSELKTGAGALPPASDRSEVGLEGLRPGDVVVIDGTEVGADGDYLVEGVANLREGQTTTRVAVMADGSRRRWLVGAEEEARWMVVEPVEGHGLVGEPPRQIHRDSRSYTLERRGQASAASMGEHGRPESGRVATYVYREVGSGVLWLERWGDQVLLGEGHTIPAHATSFLPGS